MRLLYRLAQALVLLAVASSFAQADNFLYFKKKAAAGGGGGASTPTHVQGNKNTGTGSTLTVQLTNVAAGNLVVVFTGWSNAATVTGVSDGTTSLTPGTPKGFASRHAQFFYLLSANAGTKTYTVTYSSSMSDGIVFASEFNSSGTWGFDVENATSGTTTAGNSGNITTTGTAEVAICVNKLWDSGATISSPLINGVTPTEPAYSPANTYDHLYYRLLSATFADGACSGTYSGNTNWIWSIVSFKAS